MWDGQAGFRQGVADGDGEERVLYDEEDGEEGRGKEEWEKPGCRR